MMRTLILTLAVAFLCRAGQAAENLDYHLPDPELRLVRLDSAVSESFLAVRADALGRLFVGGREELFVYEPDNKGGYQSRRSLFKFPNHTWVYDIEIRGDDLYVLTVSALYLIPDGASKREGLKVKRLVWGVPLGHVHQCFHALAWGPEGDLYFSMGDPLWYYGDFARPDHWGHWTFFSQPEGARTPYTGVGGVFRCKPDGSGFQIVARGLRNPCGLCFDRHWNLFSNDNDHEGLPALYVPGRMLHVTPHADFAWPRGWMLHKSPERADLLQTMFDGMGRGVPVLQTYYHDTHLPEKYRDNLFVTRWGIRAITRYPLEPRGASFKAPEKPLLVGRDQARPVGVSVGRDGRVFATIAYMAHNEGSPVYRSDLVMITRADDPPTHPFEAIDLPHAKPEKLWAELTNPSWGRRQRAHVEILRRGGKLLDEATRRLLDSKPDDPASHHLIWLAAASKSGDSRKALVDVLEKGPATGSQAIRALTEFADAQVLTELATRALRDPDPRVQQAALMAHFKLTDPDSIKKAAETISAGPARSGDTYLRQPAMLWLAKHASFDRLKQLCNAKDRTTRLAGVLAVGSRMTLPPDALAEHLPLDKFRTDDVYVIQFADAKVDLRTLGRVGVFTVADHWKAGKHPDEQEQLFALLKEALADKDEQVRLQAAHYLYLLNDPRSEPQVAKVRIASDERRLATVPLKTINKIWLAGPFPDPLVKLDEPAKVFARVHPPEQGPIDVAAQYEVEGKKLAWKEVPQVYNYDFVKMFGKCDRSSFYAYFRLECTGRERAQLLVGSDDGIKVWHNGKLVWTNAIVRGALPTQDTVLLDLQAGSNDILIRVNNFVGDSGLYMHYRALGTVVPRLPEKLDIASLADRLKAGSKLDPEFFKTDWTKAAVAGDVQKGRQLFGVLGCVKCHAITPDVSVVGGPSLAEGRKRFTVPYVVESILAPSKQVSPVFKATHVELKNGQVFSGLVVVETGDKIELLLPDTNRKDIAKKDIAERKLLETSPMPDGVVETPAELRDLLAYLLSENPKAP